MAMIARRVITATGFKAKGKSAFGGGGGGVVTGNYPGQASNPVGYAASPGWPGSFNNTVNGTVNGNHYSVATPCELKDLALALPGGVIPDNAIIKYYDLISTNSGTAQFYINTTGAPGGALVNNVTFVGCRFQSNSMVVNVNQYVGSGNATYSYCSITPLSSLFTTPPLFGGGYWPASSVGTGIHYLSGGYPNYVIPYENGYGFGMLANSCTLDHCDIWGGGNLVELGNSSSNSIFRDCWVHDARNRQPATWSSLINYIAYQNAVVGPDNLLYGAIRNNLNVDPSGNSHPLDWFQISSTSNEDHTDFIAYTGSGVAPTIITIDHCTLAGIGNTDVIGMQDTSTQYVSWTITNNYLSGDNVMAEMGWSKAANANLTFTGNIFATDLKGFGQFCTRSVAADWHHNSNVWGNNRLRFYPNDTWTTGGLSAANDGWYVWPDGSGPQALGPGGNVNQTDFT